MIIAAHLTAVLAASLLAEWWLVRARWTWRAPRMAIATWQAVGLAGTLSAVGIPLAVGLEPYRTGPVTAVPRFAADLFRGQLPAPPRLAAIGLGLALGTLVTATHVTTFVQALRARSRHRTLLTLVARTDSAAPGALVLDHPAAAAYCLPGLRSTVVISAGALSLLDRAELAAVLSHEHAHAHERHDLVLLPFTAMCRALPGLRWPAVAYDAVALLIEMRADDRAGRQHGAGRLAGALMRFASAPATAAPAGALGLAYAPVSALGLSDRHLAARIQRLHAAPPAARGLPTLCVTAAALLLATPVSLLG